MRYGYLAERDARAQLRDAALRMQCSVFAPVADVSILITRLVNSWYYIRPLAMYVCWLSAILGDWL